MVLVPLPIWIALILLLACLAIPNRFLVSIIPVEPFRPQRPQRSWPYRVAAGVYYVLIVCNILMHTLEIVRLALIRFGIGLLPFAYVGLVLGGALHWSRGAGGQVPAWMAVNLLVWVGGMVMSVVKVVGLDNEGNPRRGSKYPMSDQVLDVAVIAGVYGVIAVLEVVTALWRKRSMGVSK